MTKEHFNDIFTEAGFSKFQLFYIEAVMNDSSLPMLNRLRPIFEKMSHEEFITLSEKIFAVDDYELTQQFFYFLILFRDMKHLQDYINAETFPFEALEKFIIFTFGYCGIHDTSTENIMDDILFFINRDRLFELAVNSKYIQSDKLLLFLMLSKFDAPMLNRYFSAIKDVSDVINYFLKLPDDVLRGIISRNYYLFQYILLIMSERESNQIVSSEFFEKYRADIMLFSRLNDMIREYKGSTDFEKERDLPFNQRDMSRISRIVNMVKEMPDPVKVIEYFDGEHVFIDDMEKKIVLSAVTDPMMKNMFSRYNKPRHEHVGDDEKPPGKGEAPGK
jgi:hypothetical protein